MAIRLALLLLTGAMTGDIMLFFTKIKLKDHVGKGCRYFHKPALICLRRKQRHQMLGSFMTPVHFEKRKNPLWVGFFVFFFFSFCEKKKKKKKPGWVGLFQKKWVFCQP